MIPRIRQPKCIQAARVRGAQLAACFLVASVSGVATGQLKINEVYYHVAPPGGNQFVELLNTAATNVYLDGLVLTDEAGFGTEGVYQFPGTPGGTSLPVAPGARVVIAVDGIGSTATADWECFAGGADADNPAVSNLVKVSGIDDLGFALAGDNCLLGSGTDTTAPLDTATIMDGVNFGDGGGELALVAADQPDQALGLVALAGQSAGRCLDGVDSDFGSAQDFISATPSMAASNVCTLPRMSIADASGPESNSGTNLMAITISLSFSATNQISAILVTSNGSATAGVDYGALAGQAVIFSPGTTSVVAAVPILGDLLAEGNEVFYLRLFYPTNTILVDEFAQATILDEETASGLFTTALTRISGPAAALTTEWTAVSGRTYQVQVGTTLMSPLWTNVGSVVTALSSLVQTVDTSGGNVTQRFYRVLQLE